MTNDKVKGMTVSYNLLNQPATITMATGDVIKYTYAANGTKVRGEIAPNGGTTTIKDYIANEVYTGKILSFFSHEEGRVVYQGGVLRPEYTLKDHLDNSRLCFTDANLPLVSPGRQVSILISFAKSQP